MFENLKGMLGDAYHEGMTAEEVNNFFAGKTFADLSTGNYVDKNKYDRDVQALNKTISDQKHTIDSKLTEDEKKLADEKAKDDEIARLQTLLKQNSMLSNADLVKSQMANVKTLLDIKDDDKEYMEFIENIVSEDRTKSNAISSYIAKVIKDAYDKGTKDSTKDAMGQFAKVHKEGTNSKKKENEPSLGTKLAKASIGNKDKKIDYFNRNK